MKFTNNFYSPIAWQRTDRAVKALQSTSHKPILAKQWNTSSHKSTSLQTRDNCCVYKTQLSFKTDKSGTLAQTFRQLKWKYSHCLQNSRPHLSATRSDGSENKRTESVRNESDPHPHLPVSQLSYVEGLVMSGWHLSLGIPINANQSCY